MDKKDLRWQSWAQAICEGASLAQRKWTGKNRLFRRVEYEIGLWRLAQAGIIKNLGRRGYRPDRAEGWKYIHAMARGEKDLPPPPLETSSQVWNIPVKRARTQARTSARIVSRTITKQERKEKMRMQMVRQTKTRSIFYLFNDKGECVARIEKPFLLSFEQSKEYAEEYRRTHPEDFPGEVQNDKMDH